MTNPNRQAQVRIDDPGWLGWDDWHPGDQPVFVCDLSKAQEKLGWQPRIGAEAGVKDLAAWVAQNPELFAWLK